LLRTARHLDRCDACAATYLPINSFRNEAQGAHGRTPWAAASAMRHEDRKFCRSGSVVGIWDRQVQPSTFGPSLSQRTSVSARCWPSYLRRRRLRGIARQDRCHLVPLCVIFCFDNGKLIGKTTYSTMCPCLSRSVVPCTPCVQRRADTRTAFRRQQAAFCSAVSTFLRPVLTLSQFNSAFNALVSFVELLKP
jgi:hypothetical protein